MALTTPSILAATSISREATVAIGITSSRGSVASIEGGGSSKLGRDPNSLWSSWTEFFISFNKFCVLGDFFIVLMVIASSLITLEETEPNLKQLPLRCCFMDSGTCSSVEKEMKSFVSRVVDVTVSSSRIDIVHEIYTLHADKEGHPCEDKVKGKSTIYIPMGASSPPCKGMSLSCHYEIIFMG